jgi:DNA-binding NtrC family response regulator
MTFGYSDNGVLERECGDRPAVPPRLEEDIGCAARSHVPVLITGLPEDGKEIACAIDRRSRSPRGRVEVVDCRQDGAFTRVMSLARQEAEPPRPRRPAIVLLQEVHALSLSEQAEVDDRLAEIRASRRAAGVRFIASSSMPLFEKVQEGAFDERLFYRLNVIHLVVA